MNKTRVNVWMGIATVLLLLALRAAAGNYWLLWDDPNPAGTVQKYGVHHSTNLAGPFELIGTPTVKSNLLPPLKSGFHVFFVTAIGTNGFESDPSNSVFAPVVQSVHTELIYIP